MRISWKDAAPDDVIRSLADRSRVLDASAAREIGERVASYRLSDPSIGHRIAAAFVEAASRPAGAAHHGPGPDPAVLVGALAWTSLAESSNATGRIKESLPAFERAAALARAAGDDALLGRVMLGHVHVLALSGHREESESLAAEAESLLARSGNQVLLAKLLMNRGNAHYQEDRYREAYECYRRADRAFEQAGLQDSARIGLHMNQAVAATNLEEFDEARRLFLLAESESEALGVAHLEAFARFNHASLERTLGDYREALRLLEAAERTFEHQASRDMVAASKLERAGIYLELGMPARSLELLSPAEETFAAESMELDRELARTDRARALLAMGDAAAAIPLIREGAAWFHARQNRTREAGALALLAEATLAAGMPRDAAESARSALRLLGREEMLRASTRSRVHLARALVTLGRAGMAARALEPALRGVSRLPTRSRMELWTAAGEVARARGETGQARRHFRRAAGLVEWERRFIPGVELRSRAFERFGGVYRELARLELGESRPRFHVLLELAERARARSFHDRLVSADEVPGAPASSRRLPGAGERAGADAIDEQRGRLRAWIRRLEEAENPGAGAPDAGKAAQIRRRVVALEHEIARRLRAEEEREREAAPRGSRGRPAGGGAILGALGEDEVMIQYLLLEDDVLALATDGARHVPLLLPSGAREIREAIDAVRFQLESAVLPGGMDPGALAFARRASDHALRSLHAMLVAPVLQGFPDDARLIVVPDGMLHRVPFQCLHDGREYLGTRRVVSRLPAGSLLRRREAGRLAWPAANPGAGRVLVSGTITGGPAFIGRELDAVAAHFPDRALVLRDAPAAGILRELETARIAHLSSHGSFRDDNPAFSRLATADGAIFVADLLERRLACDLVVLSACQSGEVFTGGGDDLSGVAHAFLAVGARRLIASLWRVHDEATHDLMQSFYAHHVAGGLRDPALALARAERETRERWDHPAFWSSFSLHGA